MTNDTAYVVALYIRLSTEDSKIGSFSIENQKTALHQYAAALEGVKNMEVLEFVDNGFSGTNFERPAVQELLGMVQAGKINCIIVKDFTRFGRNSIDVGYFMEMVFPLYGVRFISINDDFDSNDHHGDTGGIKVAFKYLISEFYSRDLSIKYKSAKYMKFRRGEYQSVRCPYGYRKGANGRMEPDEETAPNVRLIFEMAGAGMNTSRIISELFTRGIATPGEYKAAKGNAVHDISRCRGIWGRSTLLRLLEDERYTGTYIMGKWEVTEVGGHHVRLKDESQWIKIPDHHPAIVSKELFEQVRCQIRRFKSVKKHCTEYPLKNKVFCGCCLHAMARIPRKKPAFLCQYTKVDESAACHGLEIAEAELESLLFEILSKQAQIILGLGSLADVEQLDLQLAKQTEYSKWITDCMDRKRNLYEQFLSQQITMEIYQAERAVIDKELSRLKQIHSGIAAQTTQMQMDEKTKSVRTKLAQEITSTSSLTAELADALIDRVYVHPGNQVEIVWKMNDFCVEE